MNSTLTLVGLLAAAALPFAALGASTTHNLEVSATVQGTCKFDNPGPTALTFDPIDPSSITVATKTATIDFKCTKDTPSAVAVDAPGLVRNLSDGVTNIPYTLDFGGTDAQPGTGFGPLGGLALTVTGTIQPVDFQDAPAGTYLDTVVLTISP